MKRKIVYLLASLYFFVVLFLLAGYLWSDERFYFLAFCNLAVMLFGMLIMYVPSGNSNMKQVTHNAEPQIHRHAKKHAGGLVKHIFSGFYDFSKKYLFVVAMFLFIAMLAVDTLVLKLQFNVMRFAILFGVFVLIDIYALFSKKVYFGKKLFLPKDFLFWVSVILFLLVFRLLDISSIFLFTKIFFGSLAGVLFFIISIWIFKAIGVYSVWKLAVTRLYLAICVLSLIILAPQFYFSISTNQLIRNYPEFTQFAMQNIGTNYDRLYNFWMGSGSFEDTDGSLNNLTGVTDILTGDVLSGSALKGTGVLVKTGENMFQTTGTVIDSGYENNFVGSVKTGAVSTGIANSANEVKDPAMVRFDSYSDADTLNYEDAIVYLIESNKLPFSNEKSIDFTNIAKSNSIYKYFKTAYYKKTIGRQINPKDLVKCDNYIVMKGMMKGRDISGTFGDVFSRYFKKAEDLGELNGCVRGKYIKKGNL